MATNNINISFGGLIQAILIAAKLWGKIDWSWWLVLAPTWVPLAIVGFIALGAGIGWAIWRVVHGTD